MIEACLISVGNELLCGRTVDTNAAWLGGRLFACGIPVKSIRLVPDETADIIDALQQASRQACIVLVTGGLGPTDDDLTRQALAEYLGVPLDYHPELAGQIEAFFSDRGLVMPECNRIQAHIPRGAIPIDNPRGTAPGVLFQTDAHLIALMPGVPSEMKGMFDDTVLPCIQKQQQGGPVIRATNLRCFGVGESTLAEMLGDQMLRGRNPLINCTVSDGILTLQVIASGPTSDEAEGVLARQCQKLQELLGSLVFGSREQTLQEVVGNLLRTQNKTLTVAESCTGGLLGQYLTEVAGSSDYFTTGWVTYSNDAKIQHLGVPESLIVQFGAVSEPVADAMAQRAAELSGADCALSITGIAGPTGGTDEKPVGLVFIGVRTPAGCQVHRFHYANAGRAVIRRRAVQTALNLLRLQLTI